MIFLRFKRGERKMKILRKRYIPNEVVDISDDEVLYFDDELLVTRWVPINPRNDIGRGISYCFKNKGWKISKFFDKSGLFIYWYCDIISYEEIDDIHVITDLLVDVKIFEDGHYEILDLEELSKALQEDLIDQETMMEAIDKLAGLLQVIYTGNFPPRICHRY